MSENKTQEEKLIKRLIPKITEYFKKHETLEKEKFPEFMEFIDLSIWNDKNKEEFWKEISKNSNGKNLQKVVLVRNLTEYIHNHSKELFQPEASLQKNLTKFLEMPVKLIEDIDSENESMYEFYRLLATLEYSNSQSISLLTLESVVKEYKFINLNKDSIQEIMEELLKEKSTAIKKNDYLEIMEKMDKEYRFKLNDMAQKQIVFTDKELDKPELDNFIYLLTFLNILLKLSDSVIICHEKNIQGVKNKEVLNSEYFNRTFNILVNNMKLYFYEIMRIYYEQRQKFDYFSIANISKLTILKQENKDLSEQLKAREENEEESGNENILKALYEEINVEKNKSEDLQKQNEKLKTEFSKKDEQLIEYNNKLVQANKTLKENEGKINTLNKENLIQKEKYKTLLLINREKERKLNESVKKMNLSNNLLPLVNMDKEDIISFINEKEKNFKNIEEKNKNLQKEINKLENNIQKNDKEIYDLKNMNASLNKKNEMLVKEIEDTKNEMAEQNEKSFLLSNMIDDKVDKEDYEEIEQELKNEKEKNKNLKNNIDKLNEEISKKEEELIKNKNKINSQENIIKENNDIINNLKNQLEKIKQIENKEKNDLDLTSMNKAELISMIIKKDLFIKKIEDEKQNLEKKNMEIEGKKNELENNLSEYEAKNNTLNNKNENLNKEINTLKNEIEKISKEKGEINNLLKEEKKLNEKMKNKIELLNKEIKKIEDLTNENKKLKEDIINKDDIITKAKNKLTLQKKNLDEREEKIKNILKENETLNTQYTELLNKYNDQLLNVQNREKRKEDALKNIDEKYKYLINMSIEELIKIIIDKDKMNLVAQEENKNLNNKNKSLTERNKKLEDYLNKCKDLKQKYLNLRNTNTELIKNFEDSKKERDEYKQKYDKLLESMVKKDKEPKIFKTNLLAIIKTSQLNIKKQIIKKPKTNTNQVIKKYDYLCIRFQRKITESLEDKHYDGITVFTESIKYIDDQNQKSDECILFITKEYFYLFNWDYKKCYSIPLINLKSIKISNSSNYVSLTFKKGEPVIFEIFRVLELINFFKLIKAQQKSYNYQIKIEPYIYSIEKTEKNYIQSLYYGKAYFSGQFKKKSEGVFITRYEERFGVLCEIGLIILESPTGKPKEVINLLFAVMETFNSEQGNNCLAIRVGDQTHLFSFENESISKEWQNQIFIWKKNNSFLTKFN